MPDQYIQQDFVDREHHIALMWQMQRREIETRVLAIEGRSGMGKSYLLAEFKAQCQEDGIEVISLDFEQWHEDPGYMHFVKKTWLGLGPGGFDPLTQAMRETQERSALDRIPSEFRPPASSAMASEQGGGVDIHDGTNTFGNVAGRDINNFFVSFQREHPLVQEQARMRITSALRECLETLTTQRRVVFLLDHWQKGDTDTRRWIANSLVRWLADHALPKACMVITGIEVPDLDPRRCIQKTKLTELDEQAAHAYLVEKRGLSRETAPQIIQVTGGIPLMLAMAAERRRR
jgi:hypothetical protein